MVLGLPGGGRAECGPLPVMNGVITPINGLINGYKSGIVILLVGVVTPSITGRGPTL